MTPAKPAQFHPEVPPPGFEAKFIDHWQDRPTMTAPARLQLAHTNALPFEGTVDVAFRIANRWNPVDRPEVTIPQFQIDLDGRGAMLLPLDRMGIHSFKVNGWCIGIETADTGTDADPSISAFSEAQAEQVAVAFAYSAVLYNIPLVYPDTWDGAGTACHTDPFTYPYWTKYEGKFCPGDKKKAQVRDVILPRAIAIRDAWLAPPPPDPGDGDLTPEQAQKLDDIHDALLADGYPFPGMVNMRTQVDRIYTIMNVFWDGFPGNIKDGPGVLARTIKNVAVKVGAKVG